MKKVQLLIVFMFLVYPILPAIVFNNVNASTDVQIGDTVTISHDRFYASNKLPVYCYDAPNTKNTLFEVFYDSIGIVRDIKNIGKDSWINIEFTGGSLYKENLVDDVRAHNFLKTPQYGWIKQQKNGNGLNYVSKCVTNEIQESYEGKFVHQCYSTQPGFTGRSACVPTSCIMACAIFNKISPQKTIVKRSAVTGLSSPPGIGKEANGYGFYVNNKYKVRGYDFNNEEEHLVSGGVYDKGAGAWGQINISTNKNDSNANSNEMLPFLKKHGLEVTDITSFYNTENGFFNKVKGIIDNNGLVIIGGDGHYKVIIGYGTEIDTNYNIYIVLDPFGNLALLRKFDKDINSSCLDGYAIFNKVIYLYEGFNNDNTNLNPRKILEVYDGEIPPPPPPCKDKPGKTTINSFSYDNITKKIKAEWQPATTCCQNAFEYKYEIKVDGVSTINKLTTGTSIEENFSAHLKETLFEITVTPTDCNGDAAESASFDHKFCPKDSCKPIPIDQYVFYLDPEPKALSCGGVFNTVLKATLNGNSVTTPIPNLSTRFEVVPPGGGTSNMINVSMNDEYELSLQAMPDVVCGSYLFKIIFSDPSNSSVTNAPLEYKIDVFGDCCCKVNNIDLIGIIDPSTGNTTIPKIECGKPFDLVFQIDSKDCQLSENDLLFEFFGPDGATKIDLKPIKVVFDNNGKCTVSFPAFPCNDSTRINIKVTTTKNSNGSPLSKMFNIDVSSNCDITVNSINPTRVNYGVETEMIVEFTQNNCTNDQLKDLSVELEFYPTFPPSRDPFMKSTPNRSFNNKPGILTYNTNKVVFPCCASSTGTARVILLGANKKIINITDHKIDFVSKNPVRVEIKPNSTIRLVKDQSQDFSATLYDFDGNMISDSDASKLNLSWKVADNKIVKTEDNGTTCKVTGKTEGSTEIYAIIKTGTCGDLFSEKISVQVFPEPVLVARVAGGRQAQLNLDCASCLPLEIFAIDPLANPIPPHKVLPSVNIHRNPNELQSNDPVYDPISSCIDAKFQYVYPVTVEADYNGYVKTFDVYIYKIGKIEVSPDNMTVAPGSFNNIVVTAFDTFGQKINILGESDFIYSIKDDKMSIIDIKNTSNGIIAINHNAPNNATATITIKSKCGIVQKDVKIRVQQNIKWITASAEPNPVSIGEHCTITVKAYDTSGRIVLNPDVIYSNLTNNVDFILTYIPSPDPSVLMFDFVTYNCDIKYVTFYYIDDSNVKTTISINVWQVNEIVVLPEIISGAPGTAFPLKAIAIDQMNRIIPNVDFTWEIDSSIGTIYTGFGDVPYVVLGSTTCDKMSVNLKNVLKAKPSKMCFSGFGMAYVFVQPIQLNNLDFSLCCPNNNALIEMGTKCNLEINPINLSCTGDLYINDEKVVAPAAVQIKVKTAVPYVIKPGRNDIKIKIVSHQKDSNNNVISKEKVFCVYGSLEPRRELLLDNNNKFAQLNGNQIIIFPLAAPAQTNPIQLFSPSFNSYYDELNIQNQNSCTINQLTFDWSVPNIGQPFLMNKIELSPNPVDYQFQIQKYIPFNPKDLVYNPAAPKNKNLFVDSPTHNTASWKPNRDFLIDNGQQETKYYWRVSAKYDRFQIDSKGKKKQITPYYTNFTSPDYYFTISNNRPYLTSIPEFLNGTNSIGLRDVCESGLGIPFNGRPCKYCGCSYNALVYDSKTKKAVIELHKHYDLLPLCSDNTLVNGVNYFTSPKNSGNGNYYDKVLITVQAGNPDIEYVIIGARVNNRCDYYPNLTRFTYKYKLNIVNLNQIPYISNGKDPKNLGIYKANLGRMMVPMRPFFEGLTKTINLAYYWDQCNPYDTTDIDNPDQPPASSFFLPSEKSGQNIKNGCCSIENSVQWNSNMLQAIFQYVP